MPELDEDEIIRDILRCENPGCITSTEQELEQIFKLTEPENAACRCIYCEAKAYLKK
jgi:aspartate carbamoyltransferase regulatory subunit